MQRRQRSCVLAFAMVFVAACAQSTSVLAQGREDDANSPWIGVGVRDLDRDDRETLDLAPGTRGVVVTRVADDGPAAAAGVQPGDVITHVEKRQVRRSRDFVGAVQRYAPGERIEVRLQRDGREKRLAVTLRARPARQPFAWEGLHWRAPRALPRFVSVDGVRLGVQGIDLDDRDLAAYFGVEPGHGVLVTAVARGSGAAGAGIRGGDVILAVAGTPLTGMASLREAVHEYQDGDSVQVRLRRQQREQSVQVTLHEDEDELSSLLHLHAPRALEFRDERQDLRSELDALRRELERLREELEEKQR